MGRPIHKLIALCAALLLASGCFGPFQLTRRLYAWNGQVGDKWEREVVFLLLALTPIYGVAVAADAIAFNSIEFWTGRNPVATARTPVADRVVFSQAEGEHGRAMTVATDAQGRVLLSAQTREDGAITVHDRSGRQVAAYSARDVEQALHVAHQDLR